jgi:hypothetical protein
MRNFFGPRMENNLIPAQLAVTKFQIVQELTGIEEGIFH